MNQRWQPEGGAIPCLTQVAKALYRKASAGVMGKCAENRR
jgi:hypothetical protein